MKSEDIVRELRAEISEKMTAIVQSTLADIVQQEIAKSLGKSLMESDFLRSVNKDIRTGLAKIYNEITGMKDSVSNFNVDKAKEVFNETENKLDFIIQSTEDASLEIMDEVESIQELQAQLQQYITENFKNNEHQEMMQNCQLIDEKLMKIMTSLAFQDITSQHIRKVVSVMKSIEQVVIDVYLSSGIMMQSKDANPEKDIEEIKDESKRKAKEYQQSQQFKQYQVDDLLKQFDM